MLGQRYCLAFAEAKHGSDLASVETRGELLANEIFITGVKTWVAYADQASAALVLCVTGVRSTGPDRLSCVMVPLVDNNVELRPLRDLSGDDSLFEVVFDGSRASLRDVVTGNGLEVATAELERSRQRDLENEFWDLVDTARQHGRDRDPVVRQQLAWAYSQIRIIPRLTDPRVAKLQWNEFHRRLGEIAVDVVGSDSLLRPEGEAYTTSHWQHVFLSSRGDTLAHGASEIQRTSIAEQMLGLPK